jgi:hypothetical protein
MKKNQLDKQACALIVQKHQTDNLQSNFAHIDNVLESMLSDQTVNKDILDNLISQAQSCIAENYIEFDVDKEDEKLIEKRLYVDPNDVSGYKYVKLIDYIDIEEDSDWELFVDNIDAYAERHNLDFGNDPFRNLMSTSQHIALEKRIKEEFSLKNANCDKYDYMIAGSCGLIGGMIDVLFVGAPGQGQLTHFTDEATDKAVQKFATLNGWRGPNEGKDATASAIGFLERSYKVNYDHRHGGDVDGLFNMSTKNHHIKSLAHSPDLLGLFFSILDQFTSNAHFIDNGKIISIDTETFELKGSNFITKLFSGFSNWIGHLFSDVAGSSGAQGRGSGIPIPFFPLLQFVNFGEFGQHKQTFAKISVQVFEQGYDFRHGMALAIPVIVTELLTRITWVVKQRSYHNKPWQECVPSANNPELRRMLLIAHGSLCLIDTADAALRSGGNMIQFMLRSNLIAWARFGTLALKEAKAYYRAGDLDIDAVDTYLDCEYKRLMTA